MKYLSKNRMRKSCRTLQNKVHVRTNVVTQFVNIFMAFKSASFNFLLLYRPDNCSEIHTLLQFCNAKYCYKL